MRCFYIIFFSLNTQSKLPKIVCWEERKFWLYATVKCFILSRYYFFDLADASFFSSPAIEPLRGQIDHRRRRNAARHFQVSSPHYRRILDVRAKWFMKDFLPEPKTILTGATAISVTVIWSNQPYVIICN